jgi:hypothetical protein
MKILDGKVLSILPFTSETAGLGNAAAAPKVWRLSLSYSGPDTVYEVELNEPLKGLAVNKTTIALNGLVEFDLYADPQISAGDPVQIAAYPPGERAR